MRRCIMLVCALIAAAFVVLPPSACRAASIDELYDEQLDASGAQELYDSMSEETEKYLNDAGIDDISDIREADIKGIMTVAVNMVRDSARKPFSACGVIVGCIVLSAVIEALRETTMPASTGAAASAAAGVAVCSAVLLPVAEHIEWAADTVTGSATFASCFACVFAAVIAASGGAASGSGYSAFMLAASGGVQTVASAVVLPVIRMLLSVAALSSVTTTPDFTSLLAFIEKHTKTLLSFIAMLFVGILGISSVAAGSADSTALKAARFTVSTAVPVIGASIGEAVATINSCIGILRASVGGFGIIALAFILLPVVIRTAMWSLAVDICTMAAELFSVRQVARLLASVSSVLAVIMAVTVFVGFVFIAASAIVLKGQG